MPEKILWILYYTYGAWVGRLTLDDYTELGEKVEGGYYAGISLPAQPFGVGKRFG